MRREDSGESEREECEKGEMLFERASEQGASCFFHNTLPNTHSSPAFPLSYTSSFEDNNTPNNFINITSNM